MVRMKTAKGILATTLVLGIINVRVAASPIIQAHGDEGVKTEVTLYGLDNSNNLYYGVYYKPAADKDPAKAANQDRTKRIDWYQISDKPKVVVEHIVAGHGGQLYGFRKTDGYLMRRAGISANKPGGNRWVELSKSPQIKVLSVGTTYLFGLDKTGNNLYIGMAETKKWQRIPMEGTFPLIAARLIGQDFFWWDSKIKKVVYDSADILQDKGAIYPPHKTPVLSYSDPKQLAVGKNFLLAVTKNNKIYCLDVSKDVRWKELGGADAKDKKQTFQDPLLAIGLKEYEKTGLYDDIWVLDKKPCRIWHRHSVHEGQPLGKSWECPYDYAKKSGKAKIKFKEIAVSQLS